MTGPVFSDPAGRPAGEPVGEPARAIAGAVRACPDVSALSAGPYGTIATYLPGGRVNGVAVRDDEVEVHVVARYGTPLPETAERVRAAARPYAEGRRVTVVVDDIDTADTADTAADAADESGTAARTRAART